MHNLERLPGDKRENIKKVKKAVNTRWLSLHASIDRAYNKYVGLL